MAATLIEPTQVINVKQICCLIYGQPGSRKSSLAQTADDPLTLAFDPGIYRAFGRRKAAIFETWQDVVSFDMSGAKTIVVDTIGMCLDKLALAVMASNPRNGNKLGGLSLPGYGVLKSQFAAWVNTIRERGQNIVFTAHEKAEKVGDETYYCPDIVGGSYNTLMNHCDLVGYLHFEGGKRVLDFNPSDRYMAKVPPCGWGQIVLPDFGSQPKFLAKLLGEAMGSMGRISGDSAELARIVDDWRVTLDNVDGLEALNKLLPDVKKLKGTPAEFQVWAMFLTAADKHGWTFDKNGKKFVAKEGAAA